MAREIWSIASGVIFAIGWWIMIDGVVYGNKFLPPDTTSIGFQFFIPAIGATIALIMINMVSLDDLNQDSFMSDNNIAGKVRAWLFISFAFSFGCIAGGIAIMAAKFSDNWTGVSILLQPILVFISALILLYAKKSPSDDMGYSNT